jgi:hypothetical protein
MSRRASAIVALVLVGAALVLVGRWEAQRQTDAQVRGLERIRAAVGRVDSPLLSTVRSSPGYDCLNYRRGAERFALELCVNAEGKVLDASDRRGETPLVYSLRLDPSAGSPVIPLGELRRALARKRGT